MGPTNVHAGVAATDRGAGGPEVLVVEDDAHLRQVVEWALADEGFAVALAADGQEALARIRQERPALVLLDMGLPGLDGFGVAAGIRALHGGAVPVVVMTADGRAAEKAAQIGAVAYVRKPFDLDELIETVRRLAGG
jgi:DNA-binding response OmpR family regulator